MRGFVRSFHLFNFLLPVVGSACVVLTARQYMVEGRIEALGPAGFPLIMSVIATLLVAGIIIFEFFSSQEIYGYKIDIRDIRTMRSSVIIVLTFLYLGVVGTIGFIVASIIYEALLIITLGATKKAHVIAALVVSVAATVSIYVVYTFFFQLPVPGTY